MADTLEIELPPISPDAPCGPDLDLEGDMAFMNFTASVEGQLPNSYFDYVDDPDVAIDYKSALATATELRKRTQDLRLILLSAKLYILNRNFYSFAREVAEIAWLLANRWDEVHPQAEGGKYVSRLAQLETLNDVPTVILPLQYAALLRTERDALNYRSVMVTLGDAKPREGENLVSAGTIERMLTQQPQQIETEALVRLYETLGRLREDLAAITAATAEHAGAARAVKFDPLNELTGKMLDFAQGALTRRDPSLAPAAAGPEGAEPLGGEASLSPHSFESLTDIDNALAAALGYFQAREPSSPALLLIAQARATLGKNLYDVFRLLAPRHADAARVFVGPSGAFAIPVSSLAEAPALDFSPGEAEPAETRHQAFAIIEQVAAHLRVVEPSSPAPYLLDRARTLATRDFLTLLGEVFSPDDLESMKNGN